MATNVDIDAEDDDGSQGTGGQVVSSSVVIDAGGGRASEMDARAAADALASDANNNTGIYAGFPPMEMGEYTRPPPPAGAEYEQVDDPLDRGAEVVRDMDGPNRWNAGTNAAIVFGMVKELALIGGGVVLALYLLNLWPFDRPAKGAKPMNPRNPVATKDPIVVMDPSQTSPVEIDVLSHFTVAPGKTLQPGSVELVDADAGSGGKVKTVAGEGTWRVDPATGKVTFEPIQFAKNPTLVRYTVADDSGARSDAAGISVLFARVAVPGPVAMDDPFNNLAHTASITVDILANDTPTVGALVPGSVVLLEADPGSGGKTRTVDGQGTWTVASDGRIVFASSQFVKNPDPVRYTVANDQGGVSNPAVVRIFFKVQPPYAVEIAVPGTVGKSDPVAVDVVGRATKGSYDVDRKSVELVTVLKMDDPNAPPDFTLAANKKSIIVPHQGTWMVDLETGVITFQPERNFLKSPLPVTYRVADVKGNYSEPAMLVINELVSVIQDKVLALTQKDDAAFWKVFQTELIDPNPPLEIDIVYVIALTMFRATKTVLGGPEAASSLVLDGSRVVGATYRSAYGQWTNAGFTPAALWQVIDGFTDVTTGFDSQSATAAQRYGTRAIRLDLAVRMMRDYRADLAELEL